MLCIKMIIMFIKVEEPAIRDTGDKVEEIQEIKTGKSDLD